MWLLSRAVQTLGSAFKSILGLDFWMYLENRAAFAERRVAIVVCGCRIRRPAGLLFVAFRAEPKHDRWKKTAQPCGC
jgi:hypothetical protein